MRAIHGRGWWVQLLRGVLAVLFGVVTLVWPAVTWAVAVPLFAAFTVMDGAFAILGGISAAKWRLRWWPLLLLGGVNLGVGLLAFLWPRWTLFAFLYLVAAWATLTGLLELVAAWELRKLAGGVWLLEIRGTASLIFGILLAVFPGAEALPVLWWICGFVIVFGILLVLGSLQLRWWQRHSLPQMAG
jgi:uncharacterized membrane protein HdeD (DUF308 family)